MADWSFNRCDDASRRRHARRTCVALLAVGFLMVLAMASASPASADRNHVADVTNDGRSDLIGWNDASAWVELSTGTGFSAPQDWAEGTPFHGSVTNLTGDVNGDGRSDLIGWNDASAWVELSTGTGFSAPQDWAEGNRFYGSPAASALPEAYLTVVDDSQLGRINPGPIRPLECRLDVRVPFSRIGGSGYLIASGYAQLGCGLIAGAATGSAAFGVQLAVYDAKLHDYAQRDYKAWGRVGQLVTPSPVIWVNERCHGVGKRATAWRTKATGQINLAIPPYKLRFPSPTTNSQGFGGFFCDGG
jgi:FG-GAP-like repeat